MPISSRGRHAVRQMVTDPVLGKKLGDVIDNHTVGPVGAAIRAKLALLMKDVSAGKRLADAIDAGTAGSTLSTLDKHRLRNGLSDPGIAKEILTALGTSF